MSCKIQTALVVLILCGLAVAPPPPPASSQRYCSKISPFGGSCNAGYGNGNGNCDYCPERHKCCLVKTEGDGVNAGLDHCPIGCCIDPPNCWDMNECEGDDGMTVCGGANQICVNTIGSYKCTCTAGFTFDESDSSCKNINECLLTGSSAVCRTGDHEKCVDTDGSYCCDCEDGYKRDVSTEPCLAEWVTGKWGASMGDGALWVEGECDVTCGSGEQTRVVNCPTAPTEQCYGTMPKVTQECCTGESCPAWITSSWSDCPSCGTGVMRKRTVSCVGGAELDVLPDGSCNADGTKPSESDFCNLAACPSWVIGSWDSCTATPNCGTGTQTRAVTCVSGLCEGTKPAISQECCTGITCPAWIVTWSDCPSCGIDVMQEGIVSCVGGSTLNVLVDESQCTAGSKPTPASKACSLTPCGAWKVHVDGSTDSNGWSDCTACCGETGKQHRTFHCYNSEGDKIDDCQCPDTKPALEQGCAATPQCTWIATEWGACGVTCGTGSRTRGVSCFDYSCEKETDETHCTSTKLEYDEACTPGPACVAGDRCSSGPCQHCGVCNTDTSQPICTCDFGFKGDFCETSGCNDVDLHNCVPDGHGCVLNDAGKSNCRPLICK